MSNEIRYVATMGGAGELTAFLGDLYDLEVAKVVKVEIYPTKGTFEIKLTPLLKIGIDLLDDLFKSGLLSERDYSKDFKKIIPAFSVPEPSHRYPL